MKRRKQPARPKGRKPAAAAPLRRSASPSEAMKGAYSAFGYHSAAVARRDGASPSPGSGELHARYDRRMMLGLSREFFRDSTIYRGLIDRARDYIIGNGFGLQAKTEDPEWNQKAEAWFREFWRRPEIRGTLSGCGVEKMVMRELLLCGDVGLLKTKRQVLQIIEAEQIIGPKMMDDGIGRDEAGAPTLYYVAPYSDAGGPDVGRARKIDPRDFIYVCSPERPTSSRGVPPCQSAFSYIHRITDVVDSEALAWQLLARMAISITKQSQGLAALQSSIPDPSKSGDEGGDYAARIHQFDAGLIFHGEPGEEVKGIERNIPGKDFTASLSMFLRLMGLALGMPLEIILLDWTKSNYSQSRAVIMQAARTFEGWQDLAEDFFHRPVYQWAIDLAVKKGVLAERPDMYTHDWIRPSFPWIDQLKEAQAYSLQVDRSFATHSQVLKSQGLEREDIVAAVDREIRDAIERAQAIEADTGVKVPWEPFAGRTPAMQAPAPAQPAADQQQDEGAPPQDGGQGASSKGGRERA